MVEIGGVDGLGDFLRDTASRLEPGKDTSGLLARVGTVVEAVLQGFFRDDGVGRKRAANRFDHDALRVMVDDGHEIVATFLVNLVLAKTAVRSGDDLARRERGRTRDLELFLITHRERPLFVEASLHHLEKRACGR